jgi:VanZ family protein
VSQNPHILTPRQRVLTERVSRSIGIFIFVASLLCVLFAGTFPFDFSIPAHGAMQEVREQFDWRWNPHDPGHRDRIENILFFMPLGFGTAALIVRRKFRRTLQLFITFVISLILTSFVEISQTFVSFRDPSFADIWCNTLGGMIGAIIFIFIGDGFLNLASRFLLWLAPLARPAIIGAALFAYAVFQLSEPLLIHNPGDLSVWSREMQLSVGNAPSNDRGWLGSIWQLQIADRAISPREVRELENSNEAAKIFGDSLLADYRFMGVGPFPDLTANLPALKWFDLPSRFMHPDKVVVTGNRWLLTRENIAAAISRIAGQSQFTIATTVATADPKQYGSEQIIAIASSLHQYNLEIAQQYSDLELSVRTAVRSTPGLRLRGVFDDTQPHHLVVTAIKGRIVVYMDGEEKGRVEISPEAKVIWRLYPRGGFNLRMEQYAFRSYATIYRLLVYIPFSALLAAMLASSKWTANTRRIVALSILCVMAVLLEIVLGTQAESGFQKKNLLISLIIGLAALGGMWSLTRKLKAV